MLNPVSPSLYISLATGDPEPPEVVSSYNLPPPPPGYDDYLQSLQADHTIVTTYTVPPGSPLPADHIIVSPELLHFPQDSEYAKLLEEDAEDFSIVDSYIPKEEVEEVFSEKLETSTTPAPVIDSPPVIHSHNHLHGSIDSVREYYRMINLLLQN